MAKDRSESFSVSHVVRIKMRDISQETAEWIEIYSSRPKENWRIELDKKQEAILAKSSKSTRQGRLLETILTMPPADLFWSLSIDYLGYKRGLKSFIKIIEAENKRLWQCAMPEEAKTPFYWDQNSRILESLFFTIAAMDTRESHETLLHFMNHSYHPVVRGEVLDGMSQEKKMFDKGLVLQILNGDSPIIMRWHAIYAAECHVHEFKVKEYVDAIQPYIDHSDHNVRMLAINALSYRWAGREILQRRLQILRDTNVQASYWPHEIETFEQCLQPFADEDARRMSKRTDSNNEN